MDCYNEKMTPTDVARLKRELRGGRIMGSFVVLAGIVVVLVMWLTKTSEVVTRVWVGVIAVAVAVLVTWLANRKIKKDMSLQEKLIMPKKITDLTEEPMTMAWDVTKQASKKRGSVYYVHVGEMQFSVEKELYDVMKVGGMCELCFGAKSRVLIEVRAKK